MTSNHIICDPDDDELVRLSIHEAAQRFALQFPRKRFVVEPLQWTANHLVFLRCAFVEVTSNAPNEPGPLNNKPLTPTKRITRKQAWQWVAHIRHSVIPSAGVIRRLLEAYSFKTVQGSHLALRFEKHKILLPCEVVLTGPHRKSWKQGHCRVAFCCIRGDIQFLRETKFSPRQLEMLGILPENPYLDPCIAAILIAEAQQSQAADTTSAPEDMMENCYKVNLIVEDYEDRKNIRVYSAVISAAFLKKLSRPNEKPRSPDSARFDIRHTTLPYVPKATFPKRLVGGCFFNLHKT